MRILTNRLRRRDRRRVPRRAHPRQCRAADRLSRRPGFSKTPLKTALAEGGIDYVHLRALGTPADGRAAARSGRHADLKRIYASQLELPEAVAQGAMMVELAAEKPSALLCFERDPAVCHRSLLLEAVAPGTRVEHLFA